MVGKKGIKESSCSLVNSDPARLTVFVKPQSETRLGLKSLNTESLDVSRCELRVFQESSPNLSKSSDVWAA